MVAAPCARLQLVRGPVRSRSRGRPFNGIIRCHLAEPPQDMDSTPDPDSRNPWLWQCAVGFGAAAAVLPFVLAYWFSPYLLRSALAVVAIVFFVAYVLVDGFGGRKKRK